MYRPDLKKHITRRKMDISFVPATKVTNPQVIPGSKPRYITGYNALALVNLLYYGAKGLSHIEFLRNRGGYRLSAYIHELRKDYGLNITDEWVSKDDVRFKRYFLADKIIIIIK